MVMTANKNTRRRNRWLMSKMKNDKVGSFIRVINIDPDENNSLQNIRSCFSF